MSGLANADPSWPIEVRRGSAAELHGLELPSGRLVRRLVTDSPALVLGSTQSDSVANHAELERRGIALARRRSGGGAVLVVPDEMVWIDIHIDRGDPLWDDDVVRAVAWVGRAWQDALAELGYLGSTRHAGGLVSSAWSDLVCFAGLGPGELSIDGRKVMGLSQRRTRDRLRVQCAVHQIWRPAALLALLQLPADERLDARVALHDAVATVEAPPTAITAALVSALPA